MGLLVHTLGVNTRTDAPLPTLLKNPADVKCQIGWYFSKHNCIQSSLHELRLQTVSANTAAEHLLHVEQQEKLKPASTSLFTSVSSSCCHQQSACPFLQLTEDRFRRGETSQDPSPQKKVTPSPWPALFTPASVSLQGHILFLFVRLGWYFCESCFTHSETAEKWLIYWWKGQHVFKCEAMSRTLNWVVRAWVQHRYSSQQPNQACIPAFLLECSLSLLTRHTQTLPGPSMASSGKVISAVRAAGQQSVLRLRWRWKDSLKLWL